MKKRLTILAAASALAVLSACSGGETDNEAAPANDQVESDNMSAMANDPNNPYGQAEMQMHERMMAAVGTDVSDTWVKKMIEHHRGAIEMSNIVLQQGAEGRVRDMAQMTIDKQTKEIGELEAMVKEGAPSSEAAAAYRAGEMQMHDRMMAATGADASETWVRKMIEHHRGAIAMSELVIAQGQDARVKEKARKAAADQTKEIGDLERILSGEVASAAPASAAQAPADDPVVKTAPAPAKAAPKAAPKAAQKLEPNATSKAEGKAAPKAPPVTPACAPEHRAAGHC